MQNVVAENTAKDVSKETLEKASTAEEDVENNGKAYIEILFQIAQDMAICKTGLNQIV